MPGKLIGGKQPPWVYIAGISPESSDYAELERGLLRLFTRVEYSSGMGVGVHAGEFDAAIVFGEPPWSLADHLCVVQFGGPLATQRATIKAEDGNTTNAWALDWTTATKARQFTIPEKVVNEGLAPLIESTLIRDDASTYQRIHWDTVIGDPWDPLPELDLDAFARDSAGQVLAARMPRSSRPDSGELWSLPGSLEIEAALEWIAAAVRSWGDAGRAPFLSTPAWHDKSEWRTYEEDLAAASLLQRTSEIDAIKVKLEAELEELAARQDAARQHAEVHERRLLRAQSDELAEEVARILRSLGFDVIDADELPEHSEGRKQEDLRVSDGSWVAVAEVKGYARNNAKARDLLQVGKAARVFAVRQGRAPDAQWYVINQSFETSPDARPVPLASAPEELELFAADSGLVIDTRDLFRLQKAVQAGLLSPEDARRVLRDARGVLHYPPKVERT
ncbi:hypothetical protein ACIA49_19585 [Kribbella sp. NPDC051587]|uniref:hypothetical protein n=1 Tax=Kribbella sp. NPDC051587 TaxID=3364119 RepID=UPI0037BD15A8